MKKPMLALLLSLIAINVGCDKAGPKKTADSMKSELDGSKEIDRHFDVANPVKKPSKTGTAMRRKSMRLVTHEGEDGVAYLELLAHPTDGTPPAIARTIDLHNLIPDYFGPRLALDLDKEGRPIGMEIVYPSQDLDEEEDDG